MSVVLVFFFVNDSATTEIYTLSLHDALPIWCSRSGGASPGFQARRDAGLRARQQPEPDHPLGRTTAEGGRHYRREVLDRKSTRLNSSHANISYAVFCLKKKKQNYPSSNPSAL